MSNNYTMMHYFYAIFKDDSKVNLFKNDSGDLYFECDGLELYVNSKGNFNTPFESFIDQMNHLDEETKVQYIDYLNEVLEEKINKTLEWIG